MVDRMQDRRRHGFFRILYIPLNVFIERFILRRKATGPAPKRAPGIDGPPESDAVKVAAQSWKSGVASIDEEQEALFNALRTLQAAIKAGAGAEGITNVLRFLERYTDEHFTLEESYLEHIHFAGAADHKRLHLCFREKVHPLNQRFYEGDASVGLELINLLHGWLKEHVRVEDAAWVEFAKARPRRTEPRKADGGP